MNQSTRVKWKKAKVRKLSTEKSIFIIYFHKIIVEASVGKASVEASKTVWNRSDSISARIARDTHARSK